MVHNTFLVNCTGVVDRLWCGRPACCLEAAETAAPQLTYP
jgi:hypothetical protein